MLLAAQKRNIFVKSGDYAITTPITLYDNLHIKGEFVADGASVQNGVRFTFDNSSPLFVADSIELTFELVDDGAGGNITREDKRFYLKPPLIHSGVDIPAGTLVHFENKFVYEMIKTTTSGDDWVYIRHSIGSTNTFTAPSSAEFYPPSCRNVTIENIN